MRKRRAEHEEDAAPTDADQWEHVAGKIDHGLNRYLTRPLYRRLLEIAAPQPDDRLLDVGAGSGTVVARALSLGVDATGIDTSAAMARVAVAKVPGRYVLGGAEHLPFAERSFDVVTTSLSLHHWENVEAGLAEIARVLRPTGRLVIADLERAGPLAHLHNACRGHHSHGRYVGADEYDELLTGTGFARVSQERMRRRWVLTAARPV
jgi:ubiquinone/menaquinone biosynthesis C-methylase UbiE